MARKKKMGRLLESGANLDSTHPGQAKRDPGSHTKTHECLNCKELEVQLEQVTNQLKRALADYQNLKKRVDDEKRELAAVANYVTLSSVLEINYDFDLAIDRYTETETDEAEWLAGINMVRGKMISFLDSQSVTAIEVKEGDDFNAEYHEAIGTVVVKEKELEDKIVGIARAGYMLGEKILRPVRVVVGKGE